MGLGWDCGLDVDPPEPPKLLVVDWLLDVPPTGLLLVEDGVEPGDIAPNAAGEMASELVDRSPNELLDVVLSEGRASAVCRLDAEAGC